MSYYKTSFLKKLSLAFILLFFISVNSNIYAQEEETEAEVEEVEPDTTSKKSGGFWDKLKWGPKGGVTFSNFYNDSEGYSDSRPGFTAGFSAGIPYMDWLEFGVEVLYSRQGANDVPNRLVFGDLMDRLSFTRGKMDVVLHTIDVPVLFTYYVIGENPYVKPMFTIGHSFGMNIYAESKSDIRNDRTNEDWNSSENITKRVKFQNFGVIGGVGIEFKNDFWPIWYTAEFRYKLGYSDLSNININGAPRSNTGSFDDYNNNMFSFCFGIKF